MFAGQVNRRPIVAARHIGGGACIQYGNIFVFKYSGGVVSGNRDIFVTFYINLQTGEGGRIVEPEINRIAVFKGS